MRTKFEEELNKLNRDMYFLTDLVKESIVKSVESLKNTNIELARKIIEKDEDINRFYVDIEKECFRLISLQQPMASDMRRIVSVLKAVTDLERIGDHSVSIAKVAIRLEKEERKTNLTDIEKMEEIALNMIENMVDAFSNDRKDMIFEMAKKDVELDELHKKIYNNLTQSMENRSVGITEGTQMLFVAHHLERIGDHITNLGEWFIYKITGNISDLN